MTQDGRPRFFQDVTERIDALDLFFDLVFVLCIAQLVRLVRDDPSATTAGVALLYFVPVWWSWVGVTFATDRFPADDVIERVLVLAAAGAAATMALSLSGAPRREAAGFALGYAAVRAVLVVLYIRAGRAVAERATQTRWYATVFAVVAALWIGSVAVPPPWRWLVWVAAMALDAATPAVADRRWKLMPVDVRHLPERFGSFVIIVLGESVITTADLAAESGRLSRATAELLTLAFVIGAALWWGFFDRGAWRRRYGRLSDDDGGRIANIVCAYLHFPLVAGIGAVAVGVQLAVAEAGHDIGAAAAVALAGGGIAYLLTLNVMTWVLRVAASESLARPRLLLIAALLVMAVVGRSWDAATYVGGCAVILAAHVGANLWRDRTTG